MSKFLFFKKVLCYKKKIYDYDEDEVCVDYQFFFYYFKYVQEYLDEFYVYCK